MTKREYILEVLSRLKQYRSMAEGLSQIIAQQGVDDKSIDGLVTIFQDVFDHTIDGIQKQKLGASLTAMQKIKLLEQQERAEEQVELDAVEKLIAEI